MPARGRARVLTTREFESVVAAAAAGSHARRNELLLRLAFGLGLVVRELVRLDVGDVSQASGRLRPALSLSGGGRVLPLKQPDLRRALRGYVNERCQGGKAPVKSPLFVSQRGQRFSANSLQQVFARLFIAADIEGASSYSGRQTFAERLVEQQVPPQVLAKLLGISVAAASYYYPAVDPDLDVGDLL